VTGGGGWGYGPLTSTELYDPAREYWTYTGSLRMPRTGHTATLLPNGKVLVVGGLTNVPPAELGSTTSAELYDPASGTWTFTGSMITARDSHTATLLLNGKVLVTGGYRGYWITGSAELYDPATGLWTETGSMTTNRVFHAATLLPNGKVLVTGGHDGSYATSSAEVYDPATGVWTSTAPMTSTHESHQATLLPSGMVLVTGGSVLANKSVELYDPATATWKTGGAMVGWRHDHTATLLPNGKVLLAGGGDSGRYTSELYDAGLAFNASWQPQIATFTAPLVLGGSLAVTGSGFRGVSEGSGGNGTQDSATDYPVVQLRSIGSEQTAFLLATQWSATSYLSTPVNGLPVGCTLATVFVNGIPSASSILQAKNAATVILGNLSQTYDGTPKSVSVTTTPSGLTVNVTYNGSASLPVNAGSYTVIGTINDPIYAGSATNTLVINKASATVTLGNLSQTYDGTPKNVSVTTTPPGLTVDVTYNGSGTPPTNTGSYTVVGTVNHPNYQGSATDTLVIGKAAATVTLGNLIQAYDGTPKSVSVATAPPGLTVNVTYDGSPSPPISVGSYLVIGTVSDQNYQGSATNILMIALLPSIATQPADQIVAPGQTATFTVIVAGSEPLSYQWQLYGTNLAGATTASCVIPNAQNNNAGPYRVVVNNLVGSVTSVVARLAVLAQDIRVLVNGTNLVDGVSVVSLGGVEVGQTGQLLPFTITNAGATPLALGPVALSGANAGEYLLSTNGMATTLTPGESTVFAMAFQPASNGLRTATLQITSSDPNASPFDLALEGTGFTFAFPNLSNTDYVSAVVPQPDGKILLCGSLITAGGLTRNGIARCNADGTLDTNFDPKVEGDVYCIAVLLDGKILLGGLFTNVSGMPRTNIGRLNADGSLDTTFTATANDWVSSLALQSDGKILLGGYFTAIGETTRNCMARLNPDGSLDTAFNPDVNSDVSSLAVQANGKILIGGSFTMVGGVEKRFIARLNNNGTLDTTFYPGLDNHVYCLALQADGKILLGGAFTSVNSTTRNYIARLNANGSLDTTFNPNASSYVLGLAVQTDGRILLVGCFTSVGGTARHFVARVNANGTLDAGFDPDPDGDVFSLALQCDGRILLGGYFRTMGGFPCNYISRLPNETAAQTITVLSAAQVLWLRGGSAPEAELVSFELSTDGGGTWASLGSGLRITGGWTRTGLNLAHSGLIRARGRAMAGRNNRSSILIEQVAGYSVPTPPAIITQPISQAVLAGQDASFAVVATGSAPLSYQWRFNGGNISGATASSHWVASAQPANEGTYSVVVTNVGGSVTSNPAMLVVTNVFGLVSAAALPPVAGDTSNEARGITPDGRFVVGLSGATNGFLYDSLSNTVVRPVSSDGAAAKIVTGVGYRTDTNQVPPQPQLILSGLAANNGRFTVWMTTNAGATWAAMVQYASGPKKPTVPAANGLAGTAWDVFYAIWTDEGSGGTDNWGLRVGQFSGTWPMTPVWKQKDVTKPDTCQMNGVSSKGRAVGWRRNGTTGLYANYVADWQAASGPVVWNFYGLDGTTVGAAYAVNADGTIIFGLSPLVGGGSTNSGYKAVFNSTYPGPATQLGTNQLPLFPDTGGSTNLAIPYGCSAGGRYAVGLNCRGGIEKAVLWDTGDSNPANWTVTDLTDLAVASGAQGIFARLAIAGSIGTDATGNLVITGIGYDTNSPANSRAFRMTVVPLNVPVLPPPEVTISGSYAGGLTFSFVTVADSSTIYYLEYTTNLVGSATWTTISSTPGTGAAVSLSDSNPSGPQCYYRLRVQKMAP
jgi:uncharacterized delta-60 repeat protein